MPVPLERRTWEATRFGRKEDLDSGGGQPHVDDLADELVGDGVVVPVGLDVVVDVDLAFLQVANS